MTNIKGFTKVDNEILFNSELSNNAKLIYMQIKYYSTIPNFKLSKALILKDSKLSVNTLDKVIKELKEANLVQLNVEKEGKKNVYWYSIVGETNEVEEVVEATGATEKVEAIKQSKQSRIDNNANVRLVRSIEGLNIDNSKFDKDILSLADEEVVRSVVREFNNKAKYAKNKSFFTAKTIRYMLVQEYYNCEMNFPSIMLKKLNAVEEIPFKQYSEIADEIELRKALAELEVA